MCLIIHKPKGVQIPQDLLHNAFQNNDDGWGVMAAIEGKVVVKKGFNFKKMCKQIDRLSKKAKDVFVHLRYTTHGATNKANCHPFEFGENCYMMHNGVISHQDCSSDESMSDTAHFARTVREVFPNPEEIIQDPDFIQEIEAYTLGSRVVALRGDGQFQIYHEEEWVQKDGLLLSNTYSIVSPRFKKYRGGTGLGTFQSQIWEDHDDNSYYDHEKREWVEVPEKDAFQTMRMENLLDDSEEMRRIFEIQEKTDVWDFEDLAMAFDLDIDDLWWLNETITQEKETAGKRLVMDSDITEKVENFIEYSVVEEEMRFYELIEQYGLENVPKKFQTAATIVVCQYKYGKLYESIKALTSGEGKNKVNK